MFATKRNKTITALIAVIALIAILAITLIGCNAIPTANAASGGQVERSLNVTMNYIFELNSSENMREYNGNINALKEECESYAIPTNLIGVEVPTIIDPDGTIHYKYETVLFKNHSFNVFEYVKLTYENETHTTAIPEYRHGEIQLFELNGSTILRIVDYSTNTILCAPLKIYSE